MIDPDALARAVAAGDWDTVKTQVTDEVVRRHTAAGRPDQVRARIAEYRAAGVEEIVIAGLSDPAHIPLALQAAGT